MPKSDAPQPAPFRFAEEITRFYPDILLPEGGSLVANPGDVREFVEPPPGLWVRVDKPVKPAKAGE